MVFPNTINFLSEKCFKNKCQHFFTAYVRIQTVKVLWSHNHLQPSGWNVRFDTPKANFPRGLISRLSGEILLESTRQASSRLHRLTGDDKGHHQVFLVYLNPSLAMHCFSFNLFRLKHILGSDLVTLTWTVPPRFMSTNVWKQFWLKCPKTYFVSVKGGAQPVNSSLRIRLIMCMLKSRLDVFTQQWWL